MQKEATEAPSRDMKVLRATVDLPVEATAEAMGAEAMGAVTAALPRYTRNSLNNAEEAEEASAVASVPARHCAAASRRAFKLKFRFHLHVPLNPGCYPQWWGTTKWEIFETC